MNVLKLLRKFWKDGNTERGNVRITESFVRCKRTYFCELNSNQSNNNLNKKVQQKSSFF